MPLPLCHAGKDMRALQLAVPFGLIVSRGTSCPLALRVPHAVKQKRRTRKPGNKLTGTIRVKAPAQRVRSAAFLSPVDSKNSTDLDKRKQDSETVLKKF